MQPDTQQGNRTNYPWVQVIGVMGEKKKSMGALFLFYDLTFSFPYLVPNRLPNAHNRELSGRRAAGVPLGRAVRDWEPIGPITTP